jgi:ABC-type uncharacterized transport system permease subunit
MSIPHSTSSLTFGKSFKAGFISGVLAAGVNNIWSIIAQTLGSVPPPGFPISVTLSSIFAILVGSMIYFVLVKNLKSGYRIFLILAIVFTLVGFYPLFQDQMPDGSPMTKGFPLLAAPMHIFAATIAIWGYRKFSR